MPKPPRQKRMPRRRKRASAHSEGRPLKVVQEIPGEEILEGDARDPVLVPPCPSFPEEDDHLREGVPDGEEEAHLKEEGRYYRLTFLSGRWSHGANEGQEFHMSLEIDMEKGVKVSRDTGEEYYSFNGPLVFEAGTYDGDVYLDPHPYLWIGGRSDDNIHTTGFVLSLSPDDPYFEGAEPIPEPESGSGRRPISLPEVSFRHEKARRD